MGIQEFTGMGYCVDDRQMTWTDELQMMTSRQSCTSQLHKQITPSKMTSHPRMEMTNDAFRCSRATQVHMEDLRLVNLTGYIQVEEVNASKLLVNALDG